MSRVVGIALAGGQGVRARPLTLTSPGNVRSKAAVKLLGRPLIDWQVRALHEQGIEDFHIVAKGRSNRCQIKDVLEYGERHGVRVRYSRPRDDRSNRGSGESTLRNLDHWDLTGLALVFPTDSIFEFDLGAMVHAHRTSGAMLTVGSVACCAGTAAGKYGVLVPDRDGRCRSFVEKPTLARIHATVGRDRPVRVNAGLYLIDCSLFRALRAGGGLVGMLHSRMDWGGDLLPWLISSGARVLNWPIARLGDLGTPPDYLRTMRSVLAGDYPQLVKMLPPPVGDNVWIHESTLRRRDPVTGRTLEQRLRRGEVAIGHGVRIGREVDIGPGVRITGSDIADGVELGAGCRLDGAACMDGAMIGPAARLTDTFVGVMSTVDSDGSAPVVTDGHTAIGDEATVARGVRLHGATVDPGLVVADPC